MTGRQRCPSMFVGDSQHPASPPTPSGAAAVGWTQTWGSEQLRGVGGSGVAREGFAPSQRGFPSSSFYQLNLTEAVKPHVSYCVMIFADCSVTTTLPDE